MSGFLEGNFFNNIGSGNYIVVSYSPAPPPFAPTDLSNLALWLRADLGTTVSGGHITQWTDQSGGGYTFTNGNVSASVPYVSSGLNSLPSLGSSSVSNSGYWLTTTTNANVIMNGSACERFMVMQAQVGQPSLFSGTFGASGENAYLPYSDGNSYDDFFSSSRFQIAGQNFASPSIYDVQSAIGSWTSFVNTVQTFTSTGTSPGASTSPLNLMGSSVGNWSGLLSEVIVYNRILNSTERSQINTYLSNRYNITL
jgi:hypothetical protein